MSFAWNLSRIGAIALIAGISASSFSQSLSDIERQASERYWRNFEAARAYAVLSGTPMSVQTADGRRLEFMGIEGGRPLYRTFKDRDGARTISVPQVWPNGSAGLRLTGTGVTLGIWDDGIPNNPEFGNRVILGEEVGPGGHGTPVAGVMAAAGLDPRAIGMAFEAPILAFDQNNDGSEMANAAATRGLRISNHSYGLIDGWFFGARGDALWAWFGDPAVSENIDYKWGWYGESAREYDQIAYAAPNYLIIFALGNQRGDAPQSQPTNHWVFQNGAWTQNSTTTRERNGGTLGFDSIPNDMSAKNLLTIGAVQKNAQGYVGPAGVRMTSFSCWGPTDDGRIKPELVAPGEDMFAARAGGGYESATGTSFAAPAATGGIGLMMQHYRNLFGVLPRGVTMKAIAINGADEAGGAEGPDYAHGYGQINVLRSVRNISLATTNRDLIQERRLNSGNVHRTDLPLGSGDVRITLAWNDPASPVQSRTLNNRTPVLVNDLDVRLVRRDGGLTIDPWTLNPAQPGNAAVRGDNRVDNVEFITFRNVPSGEYEVVVSHKGSLGPNGFQDYSLVIDAPFTGTIRSFGISPSTVLGGTQPASAILRLNEARPAPTTVTLTASPATAVNLPTSVTIPANTTEFNFQINTRVVSSLTPVRVTARIPGGSAQAEFTVRPIGLQPRMEIAPGRVAGGNRARVWVFLDNPAPVGGATVNISTTLPSVASPERNWIRIPAGETSGSFLVNTTPVGTTQTVFIVANRGGTEARNDLVVDRANLLDFFASPTRVRGGTNVTGRVVLNGPAPSSGATVQLTSLDRAVATVPSTVVVPSGQREATFTIRTSTQTANRNVRIQATRFGIVQNQTITVTP